MASFDPMSRKVFAEASKPEGESLFWRVDGPTWLVAIGVYAAWFLLVIYHALIPWPVMMLLGGYVLALHFSLQHEAIHGWRGIPRWLSTAIVWPPIGGWWPFEIYRRAHSLHHRNTVLTFPGEDTETYYHRRQDWERYNPLWRGVLMFHQTLLGRLVIGPLLRWRKLVIVEGGLLLKGDFRNVAVWLGFFAGLAVILWFVSAVCGMPIWEYYVLMVYPGLSIGLIRAFIEHRYGRRAGERIAVVESNWVFGLLFLWNNLHLVHHLYPAMSWYRIPAFYRRHRAELLEHNGQYRFKGYGEVARRWFLKPVFVPVHPIK